ncbi:hypothetical protein M404DRAFT_31842 [Pisolithus tinctorius Marx 270]|uniref:Hydrophobin n=1 Tax=Pisolithus tinctorius Marx 270 TaxID=870435 RepID=A0A0C3NRJ3_PISTI|nr:hypothetical protein M404DRAFT_31842 [Pisolithus tinctorius Marx 270]
MFSKAFFSIVAATALFAASASAICPGYNLGITQTGSNTNPDYGVWQVFDDSCNIVDQVIATNPCTVGVFDCSPAPITFTGLHLDGLNYACRSDVNSGSCNGHAIQVCCRNDGN